MTKDRIAMCPQHIVPVAPIMANSTSITEWQCPICGILRSVIYYVKETEQVK